jgi:DNA-binding NtrC family response regulator
LHVFPLHLPSLRERREDIPLFIRHFVEKSSARLHKRIDVIPDEAMEAMMRWSWPGNIRELENFIERSVILSEGSRLRPPLGELPCVTKNADTSSRFCARPGVPCRVRQARRPGLDSSAPRYSTRCRGSVSRAPTI